MTGDIHHVNTCNANFIVARSTYDTSFAVATLYICYSLFSSAAYAISYDSLLCCNCDAEMGSLTR